MRTFSLILSLISTLLGILCPGSAELRQNYYADICPNVENIVREAVTAKFSQTFTTVPGTLRLFLHDCFVQGCDASVIVVSTPTNKAEKDHPDNLSLAGDGFDTVIKAKAAVDAVPQCQNKVSCADILVMATRDVIQLAGGPSYEVELGRLDGLSSIEANVNGKLPQPEFELDQLNSIFSANGLSQNDMIALSGAHTLGVSNCTRFINRIFKHDPTLNKTYADQLRKACQGGGSDLAVSMDPTTPRIFDNEYFKNLQQRKGLFTSDQSLFEDDRSRPTVNSWAEHPQEFSNAFIAAITRMGRIGVKTGAEGNIRRDCAVLN